MLLVVIPAWNEAATIARVVSDALGTGHAVLVVDDGSTDSTSKNALDAGAIVARLPVNLGVGAALRTGFLYAVEHGYDTVVQCDADGQHPIAQINRLAAAPQHLSLVIGSRFLDDAHTGSAHDNGSPHDVTSVTGSGGTGPALAHASATRASADSGSLERRRPYEIGKMRRTGIALLSRRLKRRTGLVLTDPTSGFRLLREPLLSAFSTEFPATYLSDTFEAVQLAADLVGPDGIAEVAVTMRSRQGGVPSESSLSSAVFMARTLLVTNRLITPRKCRLETGPTR